MTAVNVYCNPYLGLTQTPQVLPTSEAGYGGKVIVHRATHTYNSEAAGSTYILTKARAGWTFLFGFLYTDTSTGSTTLAVGGGPSNPVTSTTGNIANKYKAAAAITTTDVPQFFYSYVGASTEYLVDVAAGSTPGYTADEYIYVTTAAATAPSSGILYANLFFAAP